MIDQGIASSIEKRTENRSQDEKLAIWNSLKSQFSEGDKLVGQIFVKAPYGVHLDVGLAFPALLEIIQMPGLVYDEYVKDKVYCLGDKICVTFVCLNETSNEICVVEGI